MTQRHVIAAARAGRDLDVFAFSLLMDLAAFADVNGASFPSHRLLSRREGMKTTTVKRAIATLVELGFIEKEQREDETKRNTSCRYIVSLEALVAAAPNSRGATRKAPGVGSPRDGGYSRHATRDRSGGDVGVGSPRDGGYSRHATRDRSGGDVGVGSPRDYREQESFSKGRNAVADLGGREGDVASNANDLSASESDRTSLVLIPGGRAA